MATRTVGDVMRHYSLGKNAKRRIELATEGFTGKLISHNFRRVVNLLSPYKSKEKILDVGCGWGYLLSFLPRNVDVYAIDLSRNMLTISRAFGRNAERVISDAHSLGLKDDSCDKLFSIGLTGHVPDLKAVLKEMYRVLKSGGLGVVNFTGRFGLTNIPTTILKLKWGYYFEHEIMAPIDNSFTHMEARSVLERSGFKILQDLGWGFTLPHSIGQRMPNLADAVTQHVTRNQDSFLMKLISNAHVFKIKKAD